MLAHELRQLPLKLLWGWRSAKRLLLHHAQGVGKPCTSDWIRPVSRTLAQQERPIPGVRQTLPGRVAVAGWLSDFETGPASLSVGTRDERFGREQFGGGGCRERQLGSCLAKPDLMPTRQH